MLNSTQVEVKVEVEREREREREIFILNNCDVMNNNSQLTLGVL